MKTAAPHVAGAAPTGIRAMAKPNKTQPTDAAVADFIAALPDAVRRDDCNALIDTMRRASGKPPRMWGPAIVGFGNYHYRYESGRSGEMPQVAFSPRKGDLTLYLMPGFEQQQAQALLARLGKHKVGKSCLYIKRLADVDRGVLDELIDGSLAAMAARHPAAPAQT